MEAASLSRGAAAGLGLRDACASTRFVSPSHRQVFLKCATSQLLRRSLRPAQVQTSARVSAVPHVVCVADVATAEDVEFLWQGPGNEVLLTGDFLNWDSKVALTRTGDNVFTAKQRLPPGRYSYKFIVDGVWQHSPTQPTVPDGAGGFNNTISIEDKTPQKKPAAGEEPPPSPAAAPAAAAAAAPAAPAAAKKVAPAGKKVVAGKKAAGKPIGPAMEEDVIPALTANLSKEPGIEDVALVFDNNELRGSFIKNGIPYNFWAYFPDGTLDGVRGFSLTSCGNPPSTVEPFIIDERRITPDLVIFWVTKRLFAQKLLSLN